MTAQATQAVRSDEGIRVERNRAEPSRAQPQRRICEFLWINPRFRAQMAACGLTDVDAVMQSTAGRLMRRLKDRENWCLELTDGGRFTRAYLKKHHCRSFLTWLRARLGLGAGRTAARVEAEHCTQLAELGIANMCVIAYGEDLDSSGRLRSFLITEELKGYTQLDEFLDARFPDGAALSGGPEIQFSGGRGSCRAADGPQKRGSAGASPSQVWSLRELICATADVAGRFHRLGYNHRDFYTCHFFIHESSPGRFGVRLIDLQRVQKRRRFRRRWVVKDLTQLAYSAPEHSIGWRERMLFFKRYLGVDKLRRPHKRLLRSVLARERRMRRKLGPYR